jgi:tRNA(Arg) A34 adenosine deaminase TadA
MTPESIVKTLEVVADDIAIPVSNARIAAAIVYRGEIISIGVNSLKSDPLQARFSKNEHAIFLHAEIAAIKKALKRLSSVEMKKAELYIVRRKKLNGEACNGLAKPCQGCQRAIETYEIGKVIYTS